MQWLTNLRKHLLTGVSYAIPFVACGGILIALALAFAPKIDGVPLDKSLATLDPLWARQVLQTMLTIGGAAFAMMLPILAGYIAYSVAGKPGLVAGVVGGFLANQVGAGFLGALVAGLLAGYVVEALKKIPTHKLIKPIMPILVIPIVSSLVVGGAMLLIIGPPIATALDALKHWLENMQSSNAIVLAALLGAMIAFDMGGPVNKAAFFFASGLISQGNYYVMGAVAAAICTPPLGMGLATLIGRRQWTESERESGLAALGMGMIGITEGAIPFAAGDPLRVIPCIMLGSMTASTIAMLGKVQDHAPHGGLIVLPVVNGWLMYVIAIVAGTVVTAVAITTLKKIWKAPGDQNAAAA
ncbi:MAG: PTS fructose transporter subunit IIC [Phycisphaerales bacterium]